jgi:hypothetical protein
MPIDATDAGGGTRAAGGVVVVELAVGATLTEEVEPTVPVVDEMTGGEAAPTTGGGTLAGVLETAAAVVEVETLPKAATGATAGVLELVNCLFVLPWVNLIFLGSLRWLSSITTRASTGADSDRGTAISR